MRGEGGGNVGNTVNMIILFAALKCFTSIVLFISSRTHAQTYLEADTSDVNYLCDADELRDLLQLDDDVMDAATLTTMLCGRNIDSAFSTLQSYFVIDDVEGEVRTCCSTQLKR